MYKCYSCNAKPHFIANVSGISNVPVCLNCYNNDISDNMRIQHDLLVGDYVTANVYIQKKMQKLHLYIKCNHTVGDAIIPGLYTAILSKTDRQKYDTLSVVVGIEDLDGV